MLVISLYILVNCRCYWSALQRSGLSYSFHWRGILTTQRAIVFLKLLDFIYLMLSGFGVCRSLVQRFLVQMKGTICGRYSTKGLHFQHWLAFYCLVIFFLKLPCSYASIVFFHIHNIKLQGKMDFLLYWFLICFFIWYLVEHASFIISKGVTEPSERWIYGELNLFEK